MIALLLTALAIPPQADVGSVFAEAERLIGANDLSRAAQVLEDALPGQPRLADAALRIRLARVLRATNRLERALAELAEAQSKLSGSSDYERESRAYLCCERSRIYQAWGLLDVAARSLGRARELVEELESEGYDAAPVRIELDFVTTNLLRSQQDWRGLVAYVERASSDEPYLHRPVQAAVLRGLLGRGLIELARGDPAGAARVRDVLEPLFEIEGVPALDLLEPGLVLAELELRESRWERAEALLVEAAGRLGQSEIDPSHPLGACWHALRARLVRARSDDRRATEAELHALRSGLREVLDELLEEWRTRRLRVGGYGFQLYLDQRAVISELMRLEMRVEPGPAGIERALGHALAAEGAGTLLRRIGARATTLERARAVLLGPDGAQALLYYFAGAEDNHLFVVEPDAISHVALAHDDEVERARQAATGSLARPLGDAPLWRRQRRRTALAELGGMVIPLPLEERLAGWRRLTIVGAQDVPFEALPYGDATLGAALAIDYAPTLALGVALAERAIGLAAVAPGERAILVTGAPPDSGLALEREDLRATLPTGRAANVLHGAEVSLARVRGALAPADVWTLLTHGGHDPTRERPTVVALAGGDGRPAWVGADELEALDAPGIVVLAICRSERAPLRWGDAGAASLAGALFAGRRTHSVVQSSFDVDSGAALQLVGRFQRELAQGASPAEALRRARAELAEIDAFADPFYHGLIRVVGAGQRPLNGR